MIGFLHHVGSAPLPTHGGGRGHGRGGLPPLPVHPATPPLPDPLPRFAGAREGGGFTLLEVMVALAILGFALISVSEIVSGSLRSQVLARDLEVATLLARGKMAELTEKYEREGFGTGGDEEDGTFEEEGHPRFKWSAKTIEPEGTLDGRALASMMMGGASVQELLTPPADADGRQVVNPAAAGMAALLEQQLNSFAETVKKGVRELRLTVSWQEGARKESFTVVTHLVVLPASPGGPK